MTDDRQDQKMLSNASEIIQRFGGIRPMASKMDVPVTTVQGWKKRNVIPGNRRDQVLQAAQINGIDISDLLRAGAANENADSVAPAATAAAAAAPAPVTFTTVPHTVSHTAAPQLHARPQPQTVPSYSSAASSQTQQPPQAAPLTIDQELLMGRIRAVEKRAVWKSTWVSVLLVGTSMAFAAWLLWPEKQMISEHNNRIAALETDLGTVSQEQSFLKKLMPADIDQKMEAIQEHVGAMVERAEEIAGTVLGEDAGSMSARLSRLEQQVKDITNSPALVGLLEKIDGMQQTPEGQQMLSGSVAGLSSLFDMHPEESQIDGALQQAQQETGNPLGQTLEGVSPADLKAAAMLLGLAQFRNAVNRSAPFENDLALLQKMVGDSDPELTAAVARLAPQAAQGVLTPQGLSSELKMMAGDIVVASLEGDDVSVKEQAMARLNDVLQVRKNGELVTGTDTQATIARAQDLLDTGDVGGAVVVLQTLQGPAAATAQPFIEKAQITALAHKVEEMMTLRVMNKLGSHAIPFTAGTGGVEGVTRELQGAMGLSAAPSPTMPGTEKPLYVPQ